MNMQLFLFPHYFTKPNRNLNPIHNQWEYRNIQCEYVTNLT